MKRKPLGWILAVMLCLGLAADAVPARAASLKTDADLIVIGGVAIVAAVGVGVFFAFHHGRSVKGCVAMGPGGLEIRSGNGADVFELSGATAEVRAGERMRLKGRKRAAQDGDLPGFVVSGVAKDYGACAARRP
jgi:hypothetical protein